MAYPTSAADDSNLYVAKNNLETLLVGALGVSGGNNGADVEVASTANFPTAGFITIGGEAISYTSLLSGPPRFSGITRGADGTTAVSHADGSRVRHTQIAAHHNALKEEVKAIENDLVAARGALNDADTPASTASDIKDRLDQIVTQLKSLSGETDWFTATSARVKRSGDTMSGNLAMGGNKVTGLGAASTNGDAVRYEQVNGVYLPLAGGTLTGDLTLDTQKELRLKELSGTEYVSLKAPASLASNVNLTLPSDAGVSGYALKTDGSGNLSWGQASGGTKNYITNNDAEGGTTGWATYADAAGVEPVDGTSGSPTTTLTASGTTPLSGTYSFLLTKDAANRQGEGCSVNFDIDNADKAKPLYVSFDYLPSANFADDDISVWLYDRTNGVLIQPAPYLIKKVNLSERWSGVFQTRSDSTAYRLIIHIRSTSALAYTLQFDNVKVGPDQAVMGSPVTDWVPYTPTFQGFGTVTAISMFWRRVGDSITVQGKFLCGTTTAVEPRIYLPSGITIGDIGLTARQAIGIVTQNSTGSGNTPYSLLADQGQTYFTIGKYSGSGLSPYIPLADNSQFTNNVVFSIYGTVRVSGWSSSVLMSDNADTRVVAASATLITTNQAILNNTSTPVVFNRVDVDTHGAYNSSSGRYTVPVAGLYSVSATLYWVQDSFADTGFTSVELWKNGSRYSILDAWDQVGPTESRAFSNSGSTVLKLNAGDYIDIVAYQANNGGTRNLSAVNGTGTFFSIQKLSGPSQIAATETVACRYYRSSAQNISDNLLTLFAFDTKTYDSHGSYSNGVFTAPVSGLYDIKACVEWNGANFLETGTSWLAAYKNGVRDGWLWAVDQQLLNSRTGSFMMLGASTVRLLAGDTLDVRVYQANNGGTRATVGGSDRSYTTITRIGNYV